MDLNRIYGSFCWILLIIIQIYHQSDAVQVNILDTTKTESLGWVTYSKDDGDAGRRGWKEASYTNSDGDVFRVYTVCNIVNVAVDNWMRTPFIPRGSANRLYIEVKFTMRKCTKYPDPGRLQQCKESFKLLYYEADSDFANTMMPTWDSDTYKHVDVIAADRVFAEVNEAIINTETRSVSLTHGGVYFAFQDEGACSTVLSIRIYHIICPSVVANFAIFPNTSTGLELTSVSQKDGVCVENSAMFQQPSYLCQADGNWYYPTGGCDCLPGYQPLADTSQCIACPTHSYKWTSSNNQCLRCPPNSDSLTNGSVSCKCHEGFYRSSSDSPDDACTGPPSAVRNLTVVQHDHSSVLLSWLPPSDFGGRKQLSYRVECHKCEENTVFAPQRSGFNTTRVSVAGLLPQKQYTFTVYSENDITHMTGIVRRSDVTVLTDAAVAAKVTNVHVTNVGTDFVSVVWEPSRDPDNFVDLYEVKYWMMERAANTSSVFSNHTNVTLINLAHQTKYTLQVRGKTSKGWGEFSESVFAVTTNVFHYPSQGPAVVIAGSLIAVLLCFVIGCIMMVVFVRRNRRLYGEKNVSDRIALNAGRGQCSQTIDGALINSVANVSCDLLHGSQRSYIDPHTYEDPSEAVREFTKEIDVSCVVIESVIGGGEFGDVCKGKLIIPGKTDLSVAIKTLKPGSSEKSICDFLTEASIMGQFDDPNVIYLEGVITKTSPIMIITEYMENGSLDKFLRQNDSKLTILQLAGMMRGVASGMRYLAEMGFVHRDLAARNVVVSGTLVCKVTDFGLSREVEMDSSSGSYTTKGGKIPIRWTAPEAIAYRKFTSSSDVWSYGIVMWEVMSYGEWPYWDWSNQDVIEAIDRDYRLPPPMDCPEAIYQLMQDCWQKERTHRPKFSCVVQTLDKLIRSPELLQKIVQNRPEYNVLSRPNSDSSSTPCMTVSEWLMTLKMDRYSEVLNDAGYRTLADVSQIRQCDLVRLGITLAGHQKKLLNGVRNLHSTVGPFDPSTSSFV